MPTKTRKEAAKALPSKRLTGPERRDQLIQVAIRLFSERGFSGTTTREIASAAKVTEALIFRHFATKEALYAAILDYKAKEVGTEDWLETLKEYAKLKDDQSLFRSLAAKILASYRRDHQFQRLMFYSALERHELSQIFNENRGIPIFQFLCDYVEQRQKDGAFRAGDPGVMVFALVGVPTYYSIVKWLLGVDLLKIKEEEIVESFVQVVLDGLRVPNPPSKKN